MTRMVSPALMGRGFVSSRTQTGWHGAGCGVFGGFFLVALGLSYGTRDL